VAEAVHSPLGQFNAGVFAPKYGRDPDWGSKGDSDTTVNVEAVLFSSTAADAGDLKARLQAFVPAPRQTTIAALDRLPPAYDARSNAGMRRSENAKPGIEAVPLRSMSGARGRSGR